MQSHFNWRPVLLIKLMNSQLCLSLKKTEIPTTLNSRLCRIPLQTLLSVELWTQFERNNPKLNMKYHDKWELVLAISFCHLAIAFLFTLLFTMIFPKCSLSKLPLIRHIIAYLFVQTSCNYKLNEVTLTITAVLVTRITKYR